MHIPKKYFQDRLILLLLSVNTFLALCGGVLVLLRLDGGQEGEYIVQFRANQGLDAYSSGGIFELLAFVAFGLLVLIFHTILSIRIYGVRRHFSLAVLSMGLMLLAVNIIVSNALLELQ